MVFNVFEFNVFEYRIVKVEKKAFFIEYKTLMTIGWKKVDKRFKTKQKAEAWARENISLIKD